MYGSIQADNGVNETLPTSCSSENHVEKQISNGQGQKDLQDHQFPKVLGVVCQNCWKEWILPRFVEKPVYGEVVVRGRQSFLRRRGQHRQMMVNSVFSAHTSREEVPPGHAREMLQPGDHLMFRRTYVLWHHAIVESVHGGFIQVYHWSVDENGKITVHKAVLDSMREIGTTYRVVYPDDMTRWNPPALVLARAHALLNTQGYSFIDRHCENFAMYCKTGINYNLQLKWIVMKLIGQEITTLFRISKAAPDLIAINTALNGSALHTQFLLLISTGSMTMAKFTSALMQSAGQYVGGSLVVLMEGFLCTLDILVMRANYLTPLPSERGKSLTRNDYALEVTIRTSEAVFGALGTIALATGLEIAIGGAIACLSATPVGSAVVAGVVVGCLVGGTIGGIAGRIIGNLIGNFLGRAIVASFKSNDRVIPFDDVKAGDHLVIYKKLTHPRCHAIVVNVHRPEEETEEDQAYVEVVRNTYKNGVVKTTLHREDFEVPVFRVTHDRAKYEMYKPDEIVLRAMTALQQRNAKYNIFTCNCKHFCYGIVLKRRRGRYGQ